jgi:hypothetical protein
MGPLGAVCNTGFSRCAAYMGWTPIEVVHSAGGNWRAALVVALILAMFAILGWTVRSAARATYILGSSVVLGVFPQIPKLHFLQDVTHVALMIFFIASWRNLSVWLRACLAGNLQIKAHIIFILVVLVSVTFNFFLRGDVWLASILL